MPSRIKLNGMGRYDLSWHGNLRSPRITGQMVIEEGAFQYGMNNEPIQKIEFRGSFKDTVFQVESLKGMVKQIPFNLKALLIAHQNRDIDLEWNLAVSNQENILTGKGLVTQDSIRFISSINRFNLNLLQPTLSSIDQFDGICSSELEINGLRDDPEINGSFNINQFSCNLPTITSKCHQGYVALRFRNNRITVDSVGCFLNEGFCILNGYADYDMGALVGADFHLKTEQLILQHSGEWTLRIHSGDLHYTGQNKSYILEGDLILGESWLFTGFKPQNIITFFRTVEKPEIVYPDLFQQTRIRIGITNSDKVWIDNNLARLRLQPEVTLIGSLAQPNLTGRISAREGYLLYLDRKFRVAHGLLDFIDPNKVNPIVDVEAQTNLKPYQTLERIPYSITLRVTGPIQEAKTELVSEPSLDKLDIIALLTLGATRQRLSGRDSEKQSVSLGNVLKDRLAGISSDRISSYTTEKIGNLLGLEDMSIEGNLFKFGKSWGPQLVASKKITNRMEVSYTTTVGHSNDQGIRLNYYLNKKISLQGQTDQRGRSAIDLIYGLKFK